MKKDCKMFQGLTVGDKACLIRKKLAKPESTCALCQEIFPISEEVTEAVKPKRKYTKRIERYKMSQTAKVEKVEKDGKAPVFIINPNASLDDLIELRNWIEDHIRGRIAKHETDA